MNGEERAADCLVERDKKEILSREEGIEFASLKRPTK